MQKNIEVRAITSSANSAKDRKISLPGLEKMKPKYLAGVAAVLFGLVAFTSGISGSGEKNGSGVPQVGSPTPGASASPEATPTLPGASATPGASETPRPSETPRAGTNTETYVVQSGDTLYNIAVRWGVQRGVGQEFFAREVQKLNRKLVTNRNFIKVGWNLKLPKRP